MTAIKVCEQLCTSALTVQKFINWIGMRLVRTNLGSFLMGFGTKPLTDEVVGKAHRAYGGFDGWPTHRLRLTRAFYMGIHEVASPQYVRFDVHGNVEEWCYDWCGPYEPGEQIDPVLFASFSQLESRQMMRAVRDLRRTARRWKLKGTPIPRRFPPWSSLAA